METSANFQRSKRRYSFFSFLLFLFLFLGGVFYVKPLWEETNASTVERDTFLSQKQQLSTRLENLKKLEVNFNASSELNQKTTLVSIPEKLEQDKLIVELSDIAAKSDIILNGTNYNISTNASSGQIQKVLINTTFVGTEDALTAFLRGIEASKRKIVVKTITVQIGDAETGISNFTLSLEAYYQGNI